MATLYAAVSWCMSTSVFVINDIPQGDAELKITTSFNVASIDACVLSIDSTIWLSEFACGAQKTGDTQSNTILPVFSSLAVSVFTAINDTSSDITVSSATERFAVAPTAKNFGELAFESLVVATSSASAMTSKELTAIHSKECQAIASGTWSFRKALSDEILAI